MTCSRLVVLALFLHCARLVAVHASFAVPMCYDTVISQFGPAASLSAIPGQAHILAAGLLSGEVVLLRTNDTVGVLYQKLPSLLIDLTDQVLYEGEQGLLGLAFHPSFVENNRFYVHYTCKEPQGVNCKDGDTVVEEFRAENLVADMSSRRRIFRLGQPFSNHNGGWIGFSPDPADGNLYLALGDGGSGGDPLNKAQPLNSLLGKILRLDVDSTYESRGLAVAPTDNPYFNVSYNASFVWANGMRNPWRCSFRSVPPYLLLCGDVGQNRFEEVDVIQKGKNYGWPRFEATAIYDSDRVLLGNPTHTPPVVQYSHSEGGNSIIGGMWALGSRYLNAATRVRGRYVFADLSGQMRCATATPKPNGGALWSNGATWARCRIARQCAAGSKSCGLRDSIIGMGTTISGDVLIADYNGNIHRILPDQNCQRSCGPIRSQRSCNARPFCVWRSRRCQVR